MMFRLKNYNQLAEDYERIEKALIYLEANVHGQPSLDEIAAQVGLSEFHFQRLFTRWAGISPKQFLQYLTKEHAKALLSESPNLLDVAYRSGLSGPGRLHDLFITFEAVTPGEYKQKGAGLSIKYGIVPSPFGSCLIATTERGICSLKFVNAVSAGAAIAELHQEWRYAAFEENQSAIEPFIGSIFKLAQVGEGPPIHLYLRGTNFQMKVWEALLQVPAGWLLTYTDLASIAETPGARAVGNAVASNPIAYIIPCHRVIRKMGDFGNYRWGSARKKAMVGWEMARSELGTAA